MKILILIIFLAVGNIFAQGESFLWVVNPEIGDSSNEAKLNETIHNLLIESNLNSVIVTGSLTTNGSLLNLKKAKRIFSQFSHQYIIPGPNEKSASALYGTRFSLVFDKQNFSFYSDSTIIIGMSNSSDYLSRQGYFDTEVLSWLDEEFENISSQQNVIIFTNYALSKTINSNKLLAKLNGKKVTAIFSSDFTKESYINKYIAAPSAYSSKKEEQKLKINIVKISDYEISLYDLYSVKKNKFRNYTLTGKDFHYLPEKKNKISSKARIIFDKDLQYSMIAEPVVFEDKIITSDKSGIITCLDYTGETIWDYDVFGDILCSPTAADGYLAVGTAQGDVSTINIKSGESLQSIGFDEAIVTPLVSFEYKGKKKLMVPKKDNSHTAILIGTETGKLFCLDLETLEEIWQTNIVHSPIHTKPIFIKNNLYFTSADGSLYCLDSRDGTVVWKIKFQNSQIFQTTKSALLTDNSNIYFTSTNGNLFSVNAKLGTINWTKDYHAWQSLGISSDFKKLLVIGTNGRINVIKPANGRAYKIVTTNFKKSYFTTRTLSSKNIFLAASPLGNVIRINKKYSYKTILNIDNAPLHSVIKIEDGKYLISNFEGRIILFNF